MPVSTDGDAKREPRSVCSDWPWKVSTANMQARGEALAVAQQLHVHIWHSGRSVVTERRDVHASWLNLSTACHVLQVVVCHYTLEGNPIVLHYSAVRKGIASNHPSTNERNH